jgi:hypothetical protein
MGEEEHRPKKKAGKNKKKKAGKVQAAAKLQPDTRAAKPPRLNGEDLRVIKAALDDGKSFSEVVRELNDEFGIAITRQGLKYKLAKAGLNPARE